MFAALLQLHRLAVDVAGRKSERPGLSSFLGAPLPLLCARVAPGRAAPHRAVVFNSCLTTRSGADVRKLPVQGTTQMHEAVARGRGAPASPAVRPHAEDGALLGGL